MLYALALASAVLYGAADFLGGFASRRTSAIAIVVISQCAGLIALGLLFPFLPASSPVSGDVLWGAAAGLAGGIVVALLYRALAIGTMAVVAPITAVCAVMVPVIFEAMRGARLSAPTITGIALALIAIVLVSQQAPDDSEPLVARNLSDSRSRLDKTRPTSAGIRLALLSGVAIGFFFLSLARTDAAAGLWPLFAARLVSVGLFVSIALAGSHSLRLGRQVVNITM